MGKDAIWLSDNEECGEILGHRKIKALLLPEDVQGRGPGVCGGAVLRYDADRGEVMAHRCADSRVDGVGIALPVSFDIVAVVSGGGKGS